MRNKVNLPTTILLFDAIADPQSVVNFSCRPTQLISVDSVRSSGHLFSFIGSSRSPRVLGESVARKLNEFRRKASPRTQQSSDPIVFE